MARTYWGRGIYHAQPNRDNRVKKQPSPHLTQTLRSYLDSLFAQRLKLIPLPRGAKATNEPNWNKKGEVTTTALLDRGSYLWGERPDEDAELGQLIPQGFNIGVLNEPSGTIVIDMDHPKAGEAITAGLKALGVALDPKGLEMAWLSVKGRKTIYRAPPGLKGQHVRVNIRERQLDGTIKPHCVLEFRGTGYDVLPYSYRKDANHVLTWDSQHAEIPAMPGPLVRLMTAIIDDNKTVISPMKLAAGCAPDMLYHDSNTHDDYPAALAAREHERRVINAHYSVEQMLEAFGFQRHGKRWRDPNANNADGVRPSKGALGESGMWTCFHETSPICGLFDQWRLWVELGHGGDLDAASTEAKAMGRPKLATDPPPPIKSPKKEGATKAPRKTNQSESRPKTNPPPDTSSRPETWPITSVGEQLKTYVRKPTNWISRGTMPMVPGVYMLAGRAKAGKSWMALGLMVAATTGIPYAGTTFLKKHHALYISLDDTNEARMFNRLELMGGTDNPDLMNCHATMVWPLPGMNENSDRLTALYEFKERYPDLKVVILDTYGHFRGEEESKRGVYQSEQNDLSPLRRFAIDCQVVVVVLHHVNKGFKDFSDLPGLLNSISGTMAVQGGTDGNFVLHRQQTDDKSRLARLVGATRDADEDIDVCLELKDGRWQHHGPGWLATAYKPRQMVIECLKANPGKWMSSREIHAHLSEYGYEGRELSVKTLLNRMRIDGHINSRPGVEGGYQLSKTYLDSELIPNNPTKAKKARF